MEIESKSCSVCNEIKPLTEFYSQKKQSKKRGEWIYYNPECKVCTKQRYSQWMKDNPEKYKERIHYYLKNAEWRIEMDRRNSKKRRDNGKQKEWQRKNKDKLNEQFKDRQMNKEHKITTKEWENCKNYFNYRCAYCDLKIEEHYIVFRGKTQLGDFHRDHVDHNGSNDLSNCVPACKSCNTSKHNKVLKDWYKPNNELWCTVYSYERLQKIYKWLNEDYKSYIIIKIQ